MPLEEYRRKRDFARTPEPAGASEAADVDAAPLRYVIQKHAARRLHYDVRLELDGVFKSWAVPKGPSLDPHEKRLAVEVEDHPLEYGDFEGVIPEGEYGAGTVMLWDRGTWTPNKEPERKYSEGLLKFELHGTKLRGWWTLVRMKRKPNETRDNWLLMKERDDEVRAQADYNVLAAEPDSVATGRSMAEIAEDHDRTWSSDAGRGGDVAEATSPDPSAVPGAKKARMPPRVEFQLATRVKEPPTGDGWIHEVKYDGYRAMLRLRDGEAAFLTRRGKDWTDRFGPLAKAATALPVSSAILDGEAVVFDEHGVSSFGSLQEALSTGAGELSYVAFDLLYLDGVDLRAATLLDRKRLLRGVLATLPAGSPLRYADHVAGRGAEFHRQACGMALEGVVSKRSDRPHVSGRGRDWVKVRCLERQELVVGGFTDPAGGRRGFGALLVGYHDAGAQLRYAGRVGTGFSERQLGELASRLRALETDASPFADPPTGASARGVHWVRPELVAEVSFLEWTRDGALRQPSFEGLREDKSPADVVRETPAGPPKPPAAPAPAVSAGPAPAGVALTNPDRVLYPGMGVTKIDLARYYEAVAPWMLPHVADRPLTMVRCPKGHEEECFYQKHADEGFPHAVRHVLLPTSEGEKDFVYVTDAAGLVSLVQMGVLELHAWGSRVDEVERPDRIVFDLDPGPDLGWADITAGAFELRRVLEALGLPAFVKTTGGKGLHVVLPIERRLGWDETRAFSRGVVETLVRLGPERYTARMAKAERPGRIFVDYLRNAREATAVAAYSTRARHGAPVSTPLTWDELEAGVDPASFDIHTVPGRLRELDTDPWAALPASHARVTTAMRRTAGAV